MVVFRSLMNTNLLVDARVEVEVLALVHVQLHVLQRHVDVGAAWKLDFHDVSESQK